MKIRSHIASAAIPAVHTRHERRLIARSPPWRDSLVNLHLRLAESSLAGPRLKMLMRTPRRPRHSAEMDSVAGGENE